MTHSETRPMIIIEAQPSWRHFKGEEPHLSDESYGINWNAWSYYDVWGKSSGVALLLSRNGEHIPRKETIRYGPLITTRERKLHYVDEMSDIVEKCRNLYYRQFLDKRHDPVEEIADDIRKGFRNPCPKFRTKIRRERRRRRNIRRASRMLGKPPELITHNDIQTLKSEDII